MCLYYRTRADCETAAAADALVAVAVVHIAFREVGVHADRAALVAVAVSIALQANFQVFVSLLALQANFQVFVSLLVVVALAVAVPPPLDQHVRLAVALVAVASAVRIVP